MKYKNFKTEIRIPDNVGEKLFSNFTFSKNRKNQFFTLISLNDFSFNLYVDYVDI